MKRTLLIVFLFVLTNIVLAQKAKITYGGIFGINTSFMTSKADISNDFYQGPEVRNSSFTTSSDLLPGYVFGFFTRIKPLDSRFSFESNVLIAKYNNIYTLSVNWEAFYSNMWNQMSEYEKINNEFSIITIPLTASYDLNKTNENMVSLFCGLSPNFNTKKDHVKGGGGFSEISLYKMFYLSYQAGIFMNFNKIYCKLNYERSFDIKDTQDRNYFPYSMTVKKLYLSSINISVGVTLK